MWRLLTEKRLTLSMQEFEVHWSLDDAIAAHKTLDAIEAAEAQAYARARA